MGKQVFANGMEVAHKAGSNIVTAAFPDVCNSPPPPPAGPVPLPYPCTSQARDLKDGSTSVKIGGKPAALADRSYYKSSPLGDEAATRTFGGSLITHTIAGKTYFQAHAMDVAFEGKQVCRHLDITTSNHASYPGSTPPMPGTEAMVATALERIAADKCPCCKGPKHADGAPMNRDEWYEGNLQSKFDADMKRINEAVDKAHKKTAATLNPKKATQAAEALQAAVQKCNHRMKELHDQKSRLRNLMHRARTRPGCTCKKPAPPVLPSPPCDVFYERPPPGPQRDAQQQAIVEAWDRHRAKQLKSARRSPALVGVKKGDQVNHLTPKAAGGCPTGDGNLQNNAALCNACQGLDREFNEFQS